jgi:CheY-like chemotaxis protein
MRPQGTLRRAVRADRHEQAGQSPPVAVTRQTNRMPATGESVDNRTFTAPDPGHALPVPMKVLIVDDHPSFRAAARLLLEHEGFEIVGEAEDGLSGIEATCELTPDVVLLDVNLPDIDGFDVASRICTHAAHPKIVMVSSRDPREFGPLVRRSGAQGFISKGDLTGQALAALL